MSQPGFDYGTANTYDWGFCWKVWDALRSCAYAHVNCPYALGNTPEHRFIGTWSDGVPIIGLKIQDRAPIRPQPVAARQRAPRSSPQADRPPRAAVTGVLRRPAATVVRGTAFDDHGVARIQVAVVRRTGGRCRQLTSGGGFVAVPTCSSRPTSWLRATGAKRWSLRLPGPRHPGTYRVIVVATDSAGQQPTLGRHRARPIHEHPLIDRPACLGPPRCRHERRAAASQGGCAPALEEQGQDVARPFPHFQRLHRGGLAASPGGAA